MGALPQVQFALGPNDANGGAAAGIRDGLQKAVRPRCDPTDGAVPHSAGDRDGLHKAVRPRGVPYRSMWNRGGLHKAARSTSSAVRIRLHLRSEFHIPRCLLTGLAKRGLRVRC